MSLLQVRLIIWSKRFLWIKKWRIQDNDVIVTQCCFNGCFIMVFFFLLSKSYYPEWIMYSVSTIFLHSDVFWNHIKRYKRIHILQIISSRKKKSTDFAIGFVKDLCFWEKKSFYFSYKNSFFSCLLISS